MITDSDDILTELLLCLPAKSLIRLKLVCKRWLSLISSRYFSHLHTTRHCLFKQGPSLLLRLPQTSKHYHFQSDLSKSVPYNFPPILEDLDVCSYSNGLFLMRCRSTTDPTNCHVYNPTTKQSREISLPENKLFPILAGLTIAFDPTKSSNYKIICVVTTDHNDSLTDFRQHQIEVYDSDTSTWKLCGEPFRPHPYTNFNNGIYWNNGIHWNRIFLDFDNSAVRDHPIVVFPRGLGRVTYEPQPIELNGSLYSIYYGPGDKVLLVNELQRDCPQWLWINLINLPGDFGPLYVSNMMGGYSGEDNVLLIHKPRKIMAYWFAQKRFKVITEFQDETVFCSKSWLEYNTHITYLFFETLAPV